MAGTYVLRRFIEGVVNRMPFFRPGPNGAQSGIFGTPNGGWITGRNLANTADVNLARVSARDVVEVGIVPAARAYHSASQAIDSGTAKFLAFDSERFDTDAIHDPTTNNGRLTCQTAGLYSIFAHVSIGSHATGSRQIHFWVNSAFAPASLLVPAAADGHPTDLVLVTVYRLVAGDYVECVVYQWSGVQLTIPASSAFQAEFGMVRLGA